MRIPEGDILSSLTWLRLPTLQALRSKQLPQASRRKMVSQQYTVINRGWVDKLPLPVKKALLLKSLLADLIYTTRIRRAIET